MKPVFMMQQNGRTTLAITNNVVYYNILNILNDKSSSRVTRETIIFHDVKLKDCLLFHNKLNNKFELLISSTLNEVYLPIVFHKNAFLYIKAHLNISTRSLVLSYVSDNLNVLNYKTFDLYKYHSKIKKHYVPTIVKYFNKQVINNVLYQENCIRKFK